MASYRDPQLIPTVLDLINNARHPELLHICICWQHGDDESFSQFLQAGFTLSCFDQRQDDPYTRVMATKAKTKVTILDLNYLESKGACWARYHIQTFYAQEKYTLQLDSHHRFVPGWDEQCITMLESVRGKSKKPILTAYIPSFDPTNDPEERVSVPWKMNFDRFIPEGAVFFSPSAIDDYKERTKPLRSRFYSAHFCFADGTFCRDVPHDPEYFFHGEEISVGVRAFTHGYDLFHPHQILAWHEYTRQGRTKIWDDHTTTTKNGGQIDLDWVERNTMSHRRNRILFGMDGEDPTQIDFGRFGFGTERTLRQYEEYAGISFQYRGVQQATLDGVEPPVDFPYDSEAEWKASLARSNDVHICVHKNELEEIVDDFDFFFVGAHDKDGTELYRKDLPRDDIYRHLASDSGFIDFRLIFLSSQIPASYTVWPHSQSKGWIGKLTKPVG